MDKDSLINGFFEGTLSEKEMGEFHNLIATDEEFASEVSFQKELRTALKKEDRRNIKEMFTELRNDGPISKPPVIRMRRWLVAASILLVTGLGLWLMYFNDQAADIDGLYNTYFSPYENVVHPIARGNQLEDLKTRAFEAYENADYSLALKLFDELNNKQRDPYIDFYSAIVKMQLDEHGKAVELLKKYIANEGELRDRASWYLALAYLKQGQIQEAKDELGKVVQSGTFNSSKAQGLLDKLD